MSARLRVAVLCCVIGSRVTVTGMLSARSNPSTLARTTASLAPMTIPPPRSAVHSYNLKDLGNRLYLQHLAPLTNIMYKETKESENHVRRISVVGMGRVGTAIANAIARRGTATHLVLIDVQPNRAESEALDLQDTIPFLSPLHLTHSTEISTSEGSHIIIITAGARQRPGESRLELLGRNVSILSSIVPQAVKLSPNAVFLIVSNPCDVLTYVAARLAGDKAAHRVIGSGTNLDSARLVSALARRADIAAGEVNAVIMGEHGDSSVAAWSVATISGLPLRAISTDLETEVIREQLLREVRGAAAEIIKYKGYTATAVGESCADLAACILSGSVHVRPVTTRIPGGTFPSIPESAYFSVPVRLGGGGDMGILVPNLDERELELLSKSSSVLLAAQNDADVHLERVLGKTPKSTRC